MSIRTRATITAYRHHALTVHGRAQTPGQSLAGRRSSPRRLQVIPAEGWRTGAAVWVVFIGRIFAGSCKSHPETPRRRGTKRRAGERWTTEGEKFKGREKAAGPPPPSPPPPPPPPSPARVSRRQPPRHYHQRRCRVTNTTQYIYPGPSVCHRLDSTALRDDGTTGGGK